MTRACLIGSIVFALMLALPAQAKNEVPSALLQETLIKTSLLTLNDANITGNYVVLHAKLAKPFREQFSPDRLKQVFKTFADQRADWGIIVAKTPIATAEPKVDSRGVLVLRGYFDTKPSRLFYALDFLPSEGEWKPIKLNINAKPVDEK